MIQHLYHISDIHIRLYHRLEEYQEVFNAFYDFLEKEKAKDKKGLIVITGDILHHKNELSPECIVFTRSFLTKCGTFFKTLVIAGNHDALLNNQNRMDSLSAVLDTPCPNVIYWKNSGFYEIENLVFGVSSLLDKTLLKLTIPKDKEKKYVALFHGGVGKFSTNKGFWMEGIPLSTFQNYDLVLLGDIHLHQYLDREKRIAYAGSMISQNFTETDEQHGVLVWDLADLSSFLVKLPNRFAYCEGILEYPYFTWEGKRWMQKELFTKLPSKGRLNVVLSRIKTADDILWLSNLKKHLPFLNIQEKPVLLQNPQNQFQAKENDDTMNILTQYMDSLPENWEDKESLFQILKETLSWNNSSGSVHWKILEMEFSDMFAYGANNRIDFSKFPKHETIGIFGENSAGKSTLIEIMVFLLYGNITRYSHGMSVPKEVIHFGKNKSSGSITFEVEGHTYKLTKKMTLQKSGKIKVDEKLFEYIDRKWKDLSEEHRKKTDKFVQQKIGTCEQFLFTTIFLQQNEHSFRSMSPKDRKEFLFQLLDLQKLDGILQEKNEELRSLKKDLDILEKQLSSSKIEDLSLEKQKMEKEVERCQIEEHDLNIMKKEILDKIKHWFGCKNPVPHKNISSQIISLKHQLKNLNPPDLVSFPQKDRSILVMEMQDLFSKKVATPIHPPIPTELESFSIYEKDAFEDWQLTHPKQEIIQSLDSFYKEKEELFSQLVPDDPKFKNLTSKQCKSKIESMTPSENLQQLREWENQLLEEEKSLVEHTTKLQMELEKERKVLTRLEAKRDQTSKLIGRFLFSDSCSSCKQNKGNCSDMIYLETQVQKVQMLVQRKEKELLPLTTRKFELDTQKRDIQKKKLAWEEIQKLQNHLLNRSIQKKIKGIQENIEKEKLRENTEKVRKIWASILDWHKISQENKKVEEEILMIQSQIKILDKKEELEKKKKELERELKELEIFLEYEKQNEEIDQKIQELRKEEQSVVQKETFLLRQKIGYEEKLKQLEFSIEKALQQRNEFSQKQKQLSFLQHLTHVLGRDGFPMFLLETYLPKIEYQLNLLLCPFFGEKKVRLKLERKKESMTIHLCVCKGESDTIYLGGMEGFMVDAALKIVFARISRIPRPDLFIIDEGISALDKKNMENLDQLFQFLETFFSHVFIISHVKQVQDFVRHTLMVQKEKGESRLLI